MLNILCKIISLIFKSLLICALLVLSLKKADSMTAHPRSSQFIFPLGAEPMVSGSFGEFRGGHYHLGIDVRTYKLNGLPVYSMADGSVMRFLGSDWGFGRAIYIKHPKLDGYTIYGHLDSFTPELQKIWSMGWLFKSASWFRLDLPDGWMKVKQGEHIAYSGEAGIGVSHFHFEYWDKQDRSVNLLRPGFLDFIDTKPPVINKIFIITEGIRMGRNKSSVQTCVPKLLAPVNLKNPVYNCNTDIEVDGNVKFKIDTYDKTDPVVNKIGIYALQLIWGRKTVFLSELESSSRDESRFHYKVFDNASSIHGIVRYLYNLYWNGKSPTYISSTNDGIDTSNEKMNLKIPVVIRVWDAAGNSSTVNLNVVKSHGVKIYYPVSKKNLDAGKTHIVRTGPVEIQTPKLKSASYLKLTRQRSQVPGYLKAAGDAFKIEWEGQWIPLEVYYKLPFNRHFFIFNGGAKPVETVYDSQTGTYHFTVYGSQYFYGAYDYSPPVYSWPLIYGPMERDLFCLQVWDKGAGIDTRNIDIYIDGQKLSEMQKYIWGIRYDNDRHGFLIPTGLERSVKEDNSGSLHPVWIRAYDFAGNAGSLWRGFIKLAVP